MAHYYEATVHQLDFTYGRQPGQRRQAAQQGPVPQPVTAAARGTARLCVVCGRVPAHLTINLTSTDPRQRPVGLCLRCHYAVMQQRRMARAFNLPVIWGTDPNLEGRSMSIARTANVPAIYTEFLGSGLCAPDGVVAYFEGCLNVMCELGMIDRPQPQVRP